MDAVTAYSQDWILPSEDSPLFHDAFIVSHLRRRCALIDQTPSVHKTTADGQDELNDIFGV